MNIASLCRRAAVAIDADAPLNEAAQRMFDEHVGALRKGLAHEHQDRQTPRPPQGQRPVYPYFGTAATH